MTRVGNSARTSLRHGMPLHAVTEGDLLLCTAAPAAHVHDGGSDDVDCSRCRARLAVEAADR